MNLLEVRAVFISDLHLGTRDCHVDRLIAFLSRVECESLYLLGDIVDLWKARRGAYWTRNENSAVRLVLDKVRRGTRVIYVPGNHDEALREYAPARLDGIEIVSECTYETAAGKRLLLLHGDKFDGAVKHTGLLQTAGSGAYDLLMVLNRWQNVIRRRLGMAQWSLALFLKTRLNHAVTYIESYQQAALHEARKRGFDGVICGHIHKAAHFEIDGITYVNTGDWVEQCSAVVEDYEGKLHLLYWSDISAALTPTRKVAPMAAA